MIEIQGTPNPPQDQAGESIYSGAEILELFLLGIEQKIKAGYPSEVNESPSEYLNRYQDGIKMQCKLAVPRGAMLSLVETEVPFDRQLELQAIELDPAVFYRPKSESHRSPYITWVDVMSDNPRDNRLRIASVNTQQRIDSLSGDLRPASPLEAAGAGFRNILQRGFVVLAGGEVEPVLGLFSNVASPPRRLVVETFLGQPRITHAYVDSYDPLVGILVTHQ